MKLVRAACIIAIALGTCALVLRTPVRADDSDDARLRAFLRAYLNNPASDRTTRLSIRTIRPASGPEDIVVYVSGPFWCGSGGCRLLMLTPSRSTFKVLGDATIVQLPVESLGTRSHGHTDLAVFVAGGGILPGYYTKLSFDGHRYPPNPNMPPAQRIAKPRGEILFSRP